MPYHNLNDLDFYQPAPKESQQQQELFHNMQAYDWYGQYGNSNAQWNQPDVFYDATQPQANQFLPHYYAPNNAIQGCSAQSYAPYQHQPVIPSSCNATSPDYSCITTSIPSPPLRAGVTSPTGSLAEPINTSYGANNSSDSGISSPNNSSLNSTSPELKADSRSDPGKVKPVKRSRKRAPDSKRRRRTYFNSMQSQVLEDYFSKNKYPCAEMRKHISEHAGVDVRTIVIWFQNRRCRFKNENPGAILAPPPGHK